MRGESYAGGGGSGPLVASPSTLFEVRGGENRGVLSLESQRLAGRSVNKRDVSGGGGGLRGVLGTALWLLLLQTVGRPSALGNLECGTVG